MLDRKADHVLRSIRSRRKYVVLVAVMLAAAITWQVIHAPSVRADSLYFNLANGNLSQDWSNISLITTSDDWSGVPSIIGYRGDGLTGGTGTDPQTIITSGTEVVDVNANQTNPNTFITGGV